MSCSEFKVLGETLKTFEIVYTEANFVEPLPFPVSDYFRQDLQLMMAEAVVDNSEYAICKNLVYPILKEVWKEYQTWRNCRSFGRSYEICGPCKPSWL